MQFTHATRFLSLPVVLLGLYNGQRLQHEPPGDCQLFSREVHAPSCIAAATQQQPGDASRDEGSKGAREVLSTGCSFVRWAFIHSSALHALRLHGVPVLCLTLETLVSNTSLVTLETHLASLNACVSHRLLVAPRRVMLLRGKLVGAVMIGEEATEMAANFEVMVIHLLFSRAGRSCPPAPA